MLHAKAKWVVGEAEDSIASKLSEHLNVSPLLSRVLTVRGMKDTNDAAEYLYGGTDLSHDPFLLDGMDKAVERIRRAIVDREKIRIYGDYDADGVSSTTLMVHLLRQLDASFDYYIPHRIHEGYGLNNGAIDKAKEQGIGLLVTVDTGISAVEQIAYAKQLGIDVVVTDHHEPPSLLPEAYALVNPKKPNCPYPFKHLAGVGVAYKLAEALLGRVPEELLEFVAIGTVADLMQLTGENRLMVKKGIERMRATTNVGIRALLNSSGIAVKEVNSTHIGFALAPRINASGRLLSADAAVKLLVSTSEEEAEHLAFELDQLNKERQKIVDEMTKEAAAMVEEQIAAIGEVPKAIVLAQVNWNVGVIGIVASKMVDRYYRPTIILGIDPETGMAKGSARSIAGYDMYRALTHCDDLMDHFGGHPMAAGMTLAEEQVSELRRRLTLLAEEWLTTEDYAPLLRADIACGFEDIGLDIIQQLELLGPFGMGNPSPRFVFNGLSLGEIRTLGKEQQHLKLSLRGDCNETALAVEALAFSKGALADWISQPTAQVDVLGELSINEWNGVRKPQIIIQDLRIPSVQLFDWRGAAKPERQVANIIDRYKGKGLPHANRIQPPAIVIFGTRVPSLLAPIRADVTIWSVDLQGTLIPQNEIARESSIAEAQDIVLFTLPETLNQLQAFASKLASLERYYAVFGGTDEDLQANAIPSREMFKWVYGAARQLERSEAGMENAEAYCQTIARRTHISVSQVKFMLDVFSEVGLMELTENGYRLLSIVDKRDLAASELYQARLKRPEVEQILMYSSAKELLSLLMEYSNSKES